MLLDKDSLHTAIGTTGMQNNGTGGGMVIEGEEKGVKIKPDSCSITNRSSTKLIILGR